MSEKISDIILESEQKWQLQSLPSGVEFAVFYVESAALPKENSSLHSINVEKST
jgi:hypothetical protein